MSGSIYFQKDRNAWAISWYDKKTKKNYVIRRYKGALFYRTHPNKRRCHGYKMAEKCLSCMQSDVENNTFRIEKYIGTGWTDIIPYLWEWLETAELMPATYKTYKSAIKNHIEPFFIKNPFQLHEIQLDVLTMLLKSMEISPKTKLNVMYTLHACLDYAYRSNRIDRMPAFPKRKEYKISEPVIKWLPENRQLAIINAIPEEHRPIFLWLKYHLRRPAEAMALHKEDYTQETDTFIIRRSISARKVVGRTKTGKSHIIPCHSQFKPVMENMNPKTQAERFSPFFFTCSSSRSKDKRYTDTIMLRLWKIACEKVGENIDMYSGLKHSSCSQYINEKGLSESELQMITDHARLDSVKKYAKVEVARKRELMERGKLELLQNYTKKKKDMK